MGRKTIAILLCAFSLGATQARTSVKFLIGAGINWTIFFKQIKAKGNMAHKNGPSLKGMQDLDTDKTTKFAKRDSQYQDASKISDNTPEDVFKVLDALGAPDPEKDKLFDKRNGAYDATRFKRTFDPKGHVDSLLDDDSGNGLNNTFTLGGHRPEEQKKLKLRAARLARYFNEVRSKTFVLDANTNQFSAIAGMPPSTYSDYNQHIIAYYIGAFRFNLFEDFLAQFFGKGNPGDLENAHYDQAEQLYKKSAVDLLSKPIDGDFDVETADPLKSFDLSAFVIALYPINDMFKIGVAANIGYSFRELNIKNTSIKMNESLTGSIGLAIGISEYFQIHAGIGVTRREIGFKTDSDYNDYVNKVKTIFHNKIACKILETGSDTIPNSDDTSVHLALWGFIKAVFELQLNATLSLLFHAGYQFDLNSFEVNDLGKFGPLKIEGMGSLNAGVGLAYKF